MAATNQCKEAALESTRGRKPIYVLPMKTFRRILTVFACALTLAGTAVSPASAHTTDFIYPTPNGFLRGVACPHPSLVTPYGPLTICTSGTPGVFESRDVGYYS